MSVVISYLTHEDHSLFMESGWCMINTIDKCSYEQLMFLAQKSVFAAVIQGLCRPNMAAVEHSINVLSVFTNRLIEVPNPLPIELPVLKTFYKTAKVMENVRAIGQVSHDHFVIVSDFLSTFDEQL
ncbi:hypothetical protein GEMRC1_010590 [Eukaryota sp. GEM-RC1]